MALEGGAPESLFMLGGGPGRRVGSIVHAWLETLEWIEDWDPDLNGLHALGARVAPDLSRPEAELLFTRLQGWLEAAEIRYRLGREGYPTGSQVLTEEPFAVRLEDKLFQGRIDRLVLVKEEGAPVAAEVLDFKTDDIAPEDEGALQSAVSEYRGQMSIYLRAVANLFGLPLSAVEGTLLFLAPGRSLSIGS
jgi:ATP-dependent exoDNAse (exonuclease V) beta subunit